MPLPDLVATFALPAGVASCAFALFWGRHGTRAVHRMVMTIGMATIAAGMFAVGRDLDGLWDGIAVSASVILSGFAFLLLTGLIADSWRRSAPLKPDSTHGRPS